MTLKRLLIGVLLLLAIDLGIDGYLDTKNALEYRHYRITEKQK